MANPQLEDGYLKISTELCKAFAKLTISGNDWLIIWAVIIKTYGWNKKKDMISLTQFQKITGLSRPTVVRRIHRLVRYGVLGSCTGDTTHTSSYWIIKDYNKWTPSSRTDTSSRFATRPSNVSVKKVVAEQQHTKNTIQKTVKDTAKPPFLKHFGKKFKEKMGSEYHASFGKDGKIFKDLSNQFSKEDIFSRIDRFFECNDDFVINSGYTVGVFKSRFNSLIKDKSEDMDKLRAKFGLGKE